MEVYQKYGKVFQVLRKQRKFRLAHFTNIGISTATLSKFENGKAMIRLDKLILALDEMSISLSDYENFINNFESFKNCSFIQEIIIASMSNDHSMLEKWYLEAFQAKETAFSIAIKSINHKLNSDELEWIYSYFDELTLWRKVDLYSLYLTIEYFNSRQILYLVESFLEDSKMSMINSNDYKIEFVHIACRAILFLSFSGHKRVAQHILECIKSDDFPHTMYTQNLYHFTKGYWLATFFDFNKGSEIMNEAKFIFKKLCSSETLKYFQSIHERYPIRF